MNQIWLSPPRRCSYVLQLCDGTVIFNKCVIILFSKLCTLEAYFYGLTFCSVLHAAALHFSLMIFSHCHCITVSLPFLFHFALFSPPVPLPFFHNYPHLSLSSSPNSHNFTPRKNTKSQHLHLARSLHIQQVLQPVDPSAIPGLRAHLESEGDKDDGQLASASQLSQPSELTQPSSAGNPPGGLYAWEGRGSRHVQDQGVSFCKCGCCCFVCVCHRWTPANPPVVLNYLWFVHLCNIALFLGMSNFVLSLLSFRVTVVPLGRI